MQASIQMIGTACAAWTAALVLVAGAQCGTQKRDFSDEFGIIHNYVGLVAAQMYKKLVDMSLELIKVLRTGESNPNHSAIDKCYEGEKLASTLVEEIAKLGGEEAKYARNESEELDENDMTRVEVIINNAEEIVKVLRKIEKVVCALTESNEVKELLCSVRGCMSWGWLISLWMEMLRSGGTELAVHSRDFYKNLNAWEWVE